MGQEAVLCEESTDINGVCYCGCECDWRFSWKSEEFNAGLCQRFCQRECGASFDFDSCGVFTSCQEIEKVREEIFAAVVAGDRHSYCFPESSTVTLRSGVQKAMSALEVGDEVLSDVGSDGQRDFSRIIGWGHREERGSFMFVSIEAASGATVTLSAGHYLATKVSTGAERSMVTAGSVVVGELIVVGDGSLSAAVGVRNVTSRGLYNPHTASGTLVVDGVVVSCYTDALHPRMAHVLLAPVRWLARLGVRDPLGSAMFQSRSEARWVPSGPPRTGMLRPLW